MKKIFSITILFFVITQSFAQNPPRIKVPGSASSPSYIFSNDNFSFVKGKYYYSEDKRYFIILQEDGNLVIYKMTGPKTSKAIWKTGTNGIAIKSCVFQHDGNLVLYDYTGKSRWAAYGGVNDKIAGPGKLWMTLQNDGNLVIYAGQYPNTSFAPWNSGSFEKNN